MAKTTKTAKKTKRAVSRAKSPVSKGVLSPQGPLTALSDSPAGFPPAAGETEMEGLTGKADTFLPRLDAAALPAGEKAAAEEGEKERDGHQDEGRTPAASPSMKEAGEIKGNTENTDDESAEETVEFLGFLLGREEYAIQIDQVKEIIRPVELTLVPRSSAVLMGIISLRGVIVPVFNLKNKLSLLESENRDNGGQRGESLNRFVIFKTDRGVLGLLVDDVTDVIKIQEKEIKPSPPLLNKEGQDMIRGITTFKDRLVILLQANRVVEVIEKEIEVSGGF